MAAHGGTCVAFAGARETGRVDRSRHFKQRDVPNEISESVGDGRDPYTTAEINQIEAGLELARQFYFRNSSGRLNFTLDYFQINAEAPSTEGETMANIEADLGRAARDSSVCLVSVEHRPPRWRSPWRRAASVRKVRTRIGACSAPNHFRVRRTSKSSVPSSGLNVRCPAE